MQVVQWVAVVAVLAYAGYFILKKSESPVKLIIKTVVTIPFVIYIFHTAIGMGPNGLFLVMVGALLVAIIWTPHLGDEVKWLRGVPVIAAVEQSHQRPGDDIAQMRRPEDGH